jgi:hypothetical protein
VQLQQVGLKGVAGSTSPVALQLDDGWERCSLDEWSAGALPTALISLLYPSSVEPRDLLRLAGGSAESAWRVTLRVEESSVRISRRFAAESVTVEVPDTKPGAWRTVARGANEATQRIQSLLQPPPRALFEAVVLGTNPTQRNADHSPNEPGDESRVTLVTSEDLLGEMAAGVEAGEVELSVAERIELGRRFESARLRELAEDFLRSLDGVQQDVIQRMSRLVNDSGEMANVHRSIAELPPTRALSPEERTALADPKGREDDLRRRVEEAETELSRLRRGMPASIRVAIGLVAVGLGSGLLLSLYSVFGPPGAHRLAMGNLLAFGAALFGGLQWIGDAEQREKSVRRADSVARRREQLNADLEQHIDLLRELRRELSVATMQEYEQRAGARTRLEKRLAELRTQNSAQANSPEYRRLEAQTEALGAQTRVARTVLADLGEDEGFSSLMETRLRAGGWLPGLVQWIPKEDRDALREQLRLALAAGHDVGVWGAQGLDDSVQNGWRKIAERILGTPTSALGVLADGTMTIDGTGDALASLPVERAWLLIEALRLALMTALSRSDAWQWPLFVVRTRALELEDHEAQIGLQRVYETLAKKVQVLVIDIG